MMMVGIETTKETVGRDEEKLALAGARTHARTYNLYYVRVHLDRPTDHPSTHSSMREEMAANVTADHRCRKGERRGCCRHLVAYSYLRCRTLSIITMMMMVG